MREYDCKEICYELGDKNYGDGDERNLRIEHRWSRQRNRVNEVMYRYVC